MVPASLDHDETDLTRQVSHGGGAGPVDRSGANPVPGNHAIAEITGLGPDRGSRQRVDTYESTPSPG